MEHKGLKSSKDPPPLISQSIALTFLEFGLSLSSIFVTPYFTRLGIKSLVNSLIWLIPLIGIFLVSGLRKKYMYKDRHKSQFRINIFISFMSGVCLCGSLLFIFADSISEWYFESSVATNKSSRFYALILGICGFILMQSGLSICSECITELIVQSNLQESHLDLWIFRWKGLGRIAGFLLASLDIFETYTLSLYYTVGDNLTFSYCFWLLLHLCLLCVLLPVINSFDYNFRYSDYSYDIPSARLIWQAPFKAKCLFLSYFFSYASYILISIYATSWMTLALFSGAPQGAKFVVHRRDFDLGISWGSCDMLILSIVSLGFSGVYSQNLKWEKHIWVISNLLAGVGLSLCYYFDSDYYTFIFLPFCSLIFTTVSLSPSRLSSDFDKKFTKICTLKDLPHRGSDCKGPDDVLHIPPYYITQWEKIIQWTSEMSKFISLCIIPLIFAIFPKFDDNRWALKTSALWGLIGGFFALFT